MPFPRVVLGSFDGASPKGWLFAIASRVAADHRKRAHIRRERVTEKVPDTMIPPEQDEALDRRRLRELLQVALDELDGGKRAVFVLYELEGMAMQEIAETLDCPLQTAYSRLHVARERVMRVCRMADLDRGGA